MKKNLATSEKEIAELAVKTIKTLAMDAVQKANSGHPGMPMGAADVAFVLWSRYLRHFPGDPNWPDRDRFVLSAGHGSMLLYSLMHLSGYKVTINDLKQFRQWGSKTPGHPEVGRIPGVETTTGPLGQGFANGVGMAIAAKMSADRFNTKKHKIVSHRVFGIVGDGDIMEGISTEAASIAGHLKLDNLIYIYDDNKITIDGKTELTFSENIWKKFEAMGWSVFWTDGHDHASIAAALDAAIKEQEHPSLIIASTHIANGSPGKQDTSDSHGAPLGADEVKATKRNIGWPEDKEFYVPDAVYTFFRGRSVGLEKCYSQWKVKLSQWEKANPQLSSLRNSMLKRQVPAGLEKELLKSLPDKPAATRAISGAMIQKAAELIPGLCGGSADLAPSNKTFIKSAARISAGDFSGRNFHFGIREHAMGGILNGMTLYGGFIPYGGTFLVFADYMRTPIRLASLMKKQVIYVFTHDSFYVGEDGPTHQPVEQICSLRSIPGVRVIRPADGIETAMAWALAIRRNDGPTVLSLTRQTVPMIERPDGFKPADVSRGGYIVSEAKNAKPSAIIVASGSEVGSAIEAKKLLGKAGDKIRIVSMPCMELFDAQSAGYREKVLPISCRKIISIEAGSSQGWHKYIGREGLAICMDHFGESAPAKVLADKFGFTPEKVAARIKEYIPS